jgi:hypothetical protein
MRKIQLLGLALVAVFAFSAVGAASAFAESEFLLNEKMITENTAAEGEGELTLITVKVPLLTKVEVLCSGILHGEILSADPKHILITSVLDLFSHNITELGATNEFGAECENVLHCLEPLVYVDNLPWLAQVELMTDGSTLLDLTEDEEEPKGLPGYEIVCMGSTLEDLCEGLVGFLLTNGMSDVVAGITQAEMEAEKEAGTCTVGEGYVSTDVSLISSPSGSLSIS